MSPTKEERQLRALVINRIRAVIQTVFPNAKVEVFGSYCTKLYLPSSDLDVVVMESSAKSPSAMYQILNAMNKYQIASKIEFIRKAKVPDHYIKCQ